MNKRPSNLTKGKIPAHTECPFKTECPYPKLEQCGHKGVKHTVDYSCGLARLFDIMGPQDVTSFDKR